MSNVMALLAAMAVAAIYSAISPNPAPMSSTDLLGLALSAAIAALLASAVGDAIEARRVNAPFNHALMTTLGIRNIICAGATGWLVAAIAMNVAGPYSPTSKALIVQFAAVTLLSGGVAYGELISRYRDTPGRLLTADPTVVYLCVNIAAGTTALALVKEFDAITADKHKLVYEALLAGFGAIAFFRTSLFTVRVSGTDIGVGPSTLLKALLDSSDMMLNRWQALNRGAQVRTTMVGVKFDKAKSALPATCLTLISDFPDSLRASVGEQIKKLADDDGMTPDAKTIILGIYLIQQVGADVLKRAVDTLGETIK